jgi:hypothetical protein
MTLQDVKLFAKIVFGKARELVYPVTKQKLHRLFHVGATVLCAASVIGVWLVSNVHWSARVGADLVLVLTYLAKWSAVVSRVDAAVDQLPIPDAEVLSLLKDDKRGSS